MSAPRSRAFLALSASVFILLAASPAAAADYEAVASGTTRLELNREFLALLHGSGVRLVARAPAKLAGGRVTFPAVGGKLDPTTSKGTIEHAGALVFEAGGRSIPLKGLQLRTTRRRSPISVKAGGGQLKLATARSLSVSREGFDSRIRVSRLLLASKLATRLGKKLRLPDLFAEGQPLGSAVTKASPEKVALLDRGQVTLVLAPEFEAKLQSLFVAVNPIFPAEHIGPSFTLPIFDGSLAPDASIGRVETQGSMELLQLGGGQVFWAKDWLDLDTRAMLPEASVQPSPPYAGEQGRIAIADLDLAAATVLASEGDRTITVGGAVLRLQGSTAQTFNQVFAHPKEKADVFAAGETLGSIHFTAQAQ